MRNQLPGFGGKHSSDKSQQKPAVMLEKGERNASGIVRSLLR
jgi:hypothetical protein